MDQREGCVSRTRNSKVTRTRKPRGSREKILEVALREFSGKGLSGARVDRIAALAKTSKNMIYYHFSGKEGLYREVMRNAYKGIRQNERTLEVATLEPEDALRAIVFLSFDYHSNNEMFVRLVMNENIHYAKHLKRTEDIKEDNRLIIETLEDILRRGQSIGIFRSDIDPTHLHLTISALGFHYVSNRYSFSKLFDLDMSSEKAVADRREAVADIVLNWCRAR